MRSKTSNPVFRAVASRGLRQSGSGVMTVEGTINKTFILLTLVVISAAWVWTRFSAALPAGDAAAIHAVSPYLTVGVLGGLGAAIVTVFKPNWARVTAPIYAVLEGAVIGGVSALFNLKYPGIVLEAVGLTFTIMLAMLIIYRTGLIKVTQGFVRGVVAATAGVFLFYAAIWIAGIFGVDTSALISHGRLAWTISLVIVFIAALNLMLDFHFIEQGAKAGAPRYMEWYTAFGLVVTLVWLYLELLRLLALSSRR